MSAIVYPTGTTIYYPDRCWNGYTLFKGSGAVILIDMNGNVVNSWEGLGGHPPKILPGGHVVGSSGRRTGATHPGVHEEQSDIVQVDWDGNVVWSFNRYEQVDVPGSEPAWTARWHHDFERSGNPVGYYIPGFESRLEGERTLLLSHANLENAAVSSQPLVDDVIIEVTWEGEVVWKWRCSDHYEEIVCSPEAKNAMARRNTHIKRPEGATADGPELVDQGGDWAHVNSISYLGPNRWFDAGDERFHPDNIIWDGCFTDSTAIIDKKTGKLVWQVGPDYTATKGLRNLGRMIGQHHAHMIPRGLPGEGNILVFDNGAMSRPYSRVIEYDPITLKVVWQYTPREAGLVYPHNYPDFYSLSIAGMQRLPNGNTMICEGDSGRLIEVTVDHEIVWEYLTPYVAELGGGRIPWIYRAYRAPYEWVPQIDKPEETAVPRIDISTFKVPGSPPSRIGKVTRVRYDDR